MGILKDDYVNPKLNTLWGRFKYNFGFNRNEDIFIVTGISCCLSGVAGLFATSYPILGIIVYLIGLIYWFLILGMY